MAADERETTKDMTMSLTEHGHTRDVFATSLASLMVERRREAHLSRRARPCQRGVDVRMRRHRGAPGCATEELAGSGTCATARPQLTRPTGAARDAAVACGRGYAVEFTSGT